MQDYKTEYQRWLNSSAIDEKTRAELLSVKDNEKEQEDRFYTELEFGTAGLRGILGLVKSIKAASGKLAFCSAEMTDETGKVIVRAHCVMCFTGRALPL